MKYGFIGIGNMGHFMAGHCLKAGYKVVISNTHCSRARGSRCSGNGWCSG